jgi:hypothetical protein
VLAASAGAVLQPHGVRTRHQLPTTGHSIEVPAECRDPAAFLGPYTDPVGLRPKLLEPVMTE